MIWTYFYIFFTFPIDNIYYFALIDNIYKGNRMNKKEKNKLISLNVPESLHKQMKTKKNINWSEKN